MIEGVVFVLHGGHAVGLLLLAEKWGTEPCIKNKRTSVHEGTQTRCPLTPEEKTPRVIVVEATISVFFLLHTRYPRDRSTLPSSVLAHRGRTECPRDQIFHGECTRRNLLVGAVSVFA